MVLRWRPTVSFFYNNEVKVYFNNDFVDILDGRGSSPTIKDGIFYVPLRPFDRIE